MRGVCVCIRVFVHTESLYTNTLKIIINKIFLCITTVQHLRNLYISFCIHTTIPKCILYDTVQPKYCCANTKNNLVFLIADSAIACFHHKIFFPNLFMVPFQHLLLCCVSFKHVFKSFTLIFKRFCRDSKFLWQFKFNCQCLEVHEKELDIHICMVYIRQVLFKLSVISPGCG